MQDLDTCVDCNAAYKKELPGELGCDMPPSGKVHFLAADIKAYPGTVQSCNRNPPKCVLLFAGGASSATLEHGRSWFCDVPSIGALRASAQKRRTLTCVAITPRLTYRALFPGMDVALAKASGNVVIRRPAPTRFNNAAKLLVTFDLADVAGYISIHVVSPAHV